MTLNELAARVHTANQSWWIDLQTGQKKERNYGELIALCHSELSEALEGNRKQLLDDKLPHRRMEEVEIVDCIIRILDLADAFGYDLDSAFEEKMAYNAERADHKLEARILEGGKKY